MADRTHERVRLPRQPRERTAHGEIGLPRPVDVGGDDRVNALVGAQQPDVAILVQGLAEVHVATAAPGSECGMTGRAHRPAVFQILAGLIPAELGTHGA